MSGKKVLIYLTFVVLIYATAVSCAALPPDKDVKSFGEAAIASSTAMQTALDTNRVLAVRISHEREGLSYLSRKRQYALRLNETDATLVVSAKEQLSVLASLNSYAKALIQAADQGVTTELVGAANELATAAGTLAGAAAPSAAPIITPAFKLSGNLLGLAMKDRYAREVRGVIRATDPAVQEIAKRMPDSLRMIAILTKAQVENFEIKRLATLNEVRRDKRLDHLQLYKEYLVARSDIDNAVILQTALESSDGLFAKLGAAHSALAKDKPDADAQVKEFASVVNDLAALIKAVNTAGGSQ
jgi:hypothetical protein